MTGRASDSTDPHALTLELLCRANRFLDDQFIGQCVDETTYRNHACAAHRCIRRCATGNVTDRNGARNDGGDSRGGGRNIDQLGIDAVFLVKLLFLGDVPVSIG